MNDELKAQFRRAAQAIIARNGLDPIDAVFITDEGNAYVRTWTFVKKEDLAQ